jgi:hypothetical protein
MDSMALREELHKKIDKKRREIADLESKAKAAAVYILALEDTLKMLADGVELQSRPSPVADVLRTGSKTDRAREILRTAGVPLHVSKLLELMGEKSDQDSRAALVGSLGAYVRDGKIFSRTAPNTFGLIEMNEVPPNGPPPGFGLEETGQQDDGIGDDDVPF